MRLPSGEELRRLLWLLLAKAVDPRPGIDSAV